jgi:glycosyltransferase involved in cell wall biosynthesis
MIGVNKQLFSILHVLAPAPAGGLEHVVRSLAVGQARRGHRVTVAVVSERARHPFADELEGSGVVVAPVVVKGRAYLKERGEVRAIARRMDVRIIHTHGYRADVVDSGVWGGWGGGWGSGGGARARAETGGIRRVTTVHGFTGGGWRNRLYETLQRQAFRRMDAVVAVSEPLESALVGWGTAREHVHLIPNAYEASGTVLDRAAARVALGLPMDVQIVGWVGRLSREKGLDVLLSALALLRDRPVTVAVIGTGREQAALQALARQLGVTESIRWLGLVPGAGRFYRAFDIFVLSSRTEGTPIALFEAMDARVPVIATAVGGVPAVVSEKEALLIPSEDPVKLAQAVRTTLDAPPVAVARTLAARERLVGAFGVEPWLDRYDRLYAGLANHRGQTIPQGGSA